MRSTRGDGGMTRLMVAAASAVALTFMGARYHHRTIFKWDAVLSGWRRDRGLLCRGQNEHQVPPSHSLNSGRRRSRLDTRAKTASAPDRARQR